VDLKDAPGYIAGYTICNEVSERVFQFERSASQWTKGKCAEGSAPLGPWLVTGDEIADANDLPMWLDVNDKRMQTGTTKTMYLTAVTCCMTSRSKWYPMLAMS
jgi:2,4-didehydro-3-deoxy-L-rhamnonate hydrolase